MSKDGSFFGQIKNQIITGIGVVITAVGGIAISQIESILGVDEEDAPVEQVQQPMVMPTIVINNENNQAAGTKDTVVKVVKVKSKPKKTATEKRKESFDW